MGAVLKAADGMGVKVIRSLFELFSVESDDHAADCGGGDGRVGFREGAVLSLVLSRMRAPHGL